MAWGASPSFTAYPNFLIRGGTGGDGAPHGHGPVAWGASPYFMEYPIFPIGVSAGGMVLPTDSGVWRGGPPLTSRSVQAPLSEASQGECNLPPTWYLGRGASPYFTESPSSPVGGGSRGQRPLLARPRDWGASPSFRRSPDKVSLAHAGRRRGHDGRHAAALGAHPMMHLCRNTRRVWAGGGGGAIASPGVGWATGRPGEPSQTATPRWSPPCTIVAPPRWPAGDGARDLTTQPPQLDWVAPPSAC